MGEGSIDAADRSPSFVFVIGSCLRSLILFVRLRGANECLSRCKRGPWNFSDEYVELRVTSSVAHFCFRLPVDECTEK